MKKSDIRLSAFIAFVSELRRAKHYIGLPGYPNQADKCYTRAIILANLAELSGDTFNAVCRKVLL